MKSNTPMYTAAMTTAMMTTPVACSSSLRGGQVTLLISIWTSRRNVRMRPWGLVLTVPRGADGRTHARASREDALFLAPACLDWSLAR